MEKGYLAIVLHAHLPYVRHLEYDDALEERWFFEALTECYLPLLAVLENLVDEDIDFRLTLSISPTLAAMLDDPFLQYRYLNRLERLIELGDKEIHRTRSQPTVNKLARFYYHRLLKANHAFVNLYDKNPLVGFKRLQELGKIEIIASAATHGYLPLLAVNRSAARAQIGIGIDSHQTLFGQTPKGFWLPECGFSTGLDRLLADQSIQYTIVETHGITRAQPRPEHGVYAPVQTPSGVAVFGRDPESSRQVWSATEGYPGDSAYREFYRDIAYDLDFDYIKPYLHPTGTRTDTGFKYYRITGPTEHKELYVPEEAEEKAAQHADHFAADKEKKIAYLAAAMSRKPIIVAPFDAELFGHWWFEGPSWLGSVLRAVAKQHKTVRLTTLSEYLAHHPPTHTATPNTSSWGHNGFHETWLNERNDWIYPHLHQGALDMQQLADTFPTAGGVRLRALRQAARELLLAQASDWAFMINAGTTAEYAARKTKTHLRHFNKMKQEIQDGRIDKDWLTMIECRDNIFPQIDYRAFRRCNNQHTLRCPDTYADQPASL